MASSPGDPVKNQKNNNKKTFYTEFVLTQAEKRVEKKNDFHYRFFSRMGSGGPDPEGAAFSSDSEGVLLMGRGRGPWTLLSDFTVKGVFSGSEWRPSLSLVTTWSILTHPKHVSPLQTGRMSNGGVFSPALCLLKTITPSRRLKMRSRRASETSGGS